MIFFSILLSKIIEHFKKYLSYYGCMSHLSLKRVFSNESTLCMRWLEFQLQHHSFQRNPRVDLLQNGPVGSPCSPRDSQESSPTPQFKSINSSALSLLHSPTLTSIHDHRKHHSLDQTDLSWQSNVSAFEYTIQVGHNFSSKE